LISIFIYLAADSTVWPELGYESSKIGFFILNQKWNINELNWEVKTNSP
jgi:hypothetical protein